MIEFFERVYFNPNRFDIFISFILFPLSLIYGSVGLIKYWLIRPKDLGIKIISIGNISVGGSGKTPFAIELIKYFESKGLKVIYISRGYGRVSKGLIWVKKNRDILVDVKVSGDEAMLVAKSCNCDVIVSEDRVKAIKLAKNIGYDLVILDDAFSKVGIKKFDILLEPKSYKNSFVLPSGPLREFKFARKRANLILKDGIDFKRVVNIKEPKCDMMLVTAIANPKRLEPYLPKNLKGKYILQDHSFFDKVKIVEKMEECSAKSILVTQKDLVKLEQFNLPISIMELSLNIDKKILNKIEEYYES